MPKNDRLQGSLDLLVLTTLRRGAMHGFGITTRIQQFSDGVLEIEEGSLYPALHRMERDGWISSEWKTTENGIVKLTHHRLRQPQGMGSKTASEYSIWWLGPSEIS